jgi:hypothetical protein
MALTAPGGISNSSSRPFSNVFGRIALDNFNRLEGSETLYQFNTNANKNGNKLPKSVGSKLAPKNVLQVIRSTGLAR